jgi:uncharacterized membrane protein
MLRTVSRKVAKRQAVKLRNFDPGLACNDDPWLNKDLRTNAVESTASIGGHPIQAILIPSPIAFFGGALASDLAYWWTIDVFWARVSLWLVGAGASPAPFAAIFGLIDFLTLRRVRGYSAAWIHLVGNGALLSLQAVSWYVRSTGVVIPALPWRSRSQTSPCSH